jgi:hypothetical protein
MNILGKETIIVVPYHNPAQIQKFCAQWGVADMEADELVLFFEDRIGAGCAKAKNDGIQTAIEQHNAEIVVILDDDCYPMPGSGITNLAQFAARHVEALQDQPVEMFSQITTPQSRGTPYFNRTLTMPVAASLGFWNYNPDYDAAHQLVLGSNHKIHPHKQTIYGKYFAGCGMNFAFRKEWAECATMVDIERYDDIFCFLCWQKIAYEKGFCFNLCGPEVLHSRQSNVWRNLSLESEYAEFNESAWRIVHEQPKGKSTKELQAVLVHAAEAFKQNKKRCVPKM